MFVKTNVWYHQITVENTAAIVYTNSAKPETVDNYSLFTHLRHTLDHIQKNLNLSW